MSANMLKGLGKGFDSLIPTDFDSSILANSSERIQNVPVQNIIPNPDQPRKHFEDEAIAQLAASLKRYGVLQPLIVSPGKTTGVYTLVAGERRWRAAQVAGLTELPVIVRARKELEQLEVALIENVQRVDLSPLEQAVSIERLHREFNLSYTEIAKRLSKAETTLSNIVRLLHLPENARKALHEEKISEGHARAILSLKDSPDKQAELLAAIIDRGWSVRQAEQFVTAHKQGAKTNEAVVNRMASETPETKTIGKRLGTKVSLKRTARGGRIEIHFKTDEELGTLLNKLG